MTSYLPSVYSVSLAGIFVFIPNIYIVKREREMLYI